VAGQRFFTDPQGRVRPITPKKGAAGGAALADVGAAVIAASGGFSGAGAAGSVGADASIVQTVRAETQAAEEDAAQGREVEAWLRMGLKELKKVAKKDLECAVQSRGQVQQFLLRNPCRSLDGVVLAIGDPNSDLVAVSVAWVRMRSKDTTARLKKLEDAPGTGDITPIAAEVLQLGGVRFTAQHYASRQDGTLLVIAEADSLRGQPPAMLLDAAAHIADELPAP
jgi:hypothetical protein